MPAAVNVTPSVCDGVTNQLTGPSQLHQCRHHLERSGKVLVVQQSGRCQQLPKHDHGEWQEQAHGGHPRPG